MIDTRYAEIFLEILLSIMTKWVDKFTSYVLNKLA